MGERVWQVPQDAFVEAWNGAGSLPEAVDRVRILAGGSMPRWSVMARAVALRKAGVDVKSLTAMSEQDPGMPIAENAPVENG